MIDEQTIEQWRDLIIGLRGKAIDPDLLRWCAWPGCLNAYNADTGPTKPGWTRSTSPDVVLCPTHSDTGHRPAMEPAERGNPAAGVIPRCSCDTVGDPAALTLRELRDWWEQHIKGLPT